MMLYTVVVYNKTGDSFFRFPIMPEHECGVPENSYRTLACFCFRRRGLRLIRIIYLYMEYSSIEGYYYYYVK